MAVTLRLASGGQRVLENADGTRRDGPFFVVTRSYAEIGQVETVLTLRAQDVVAAEVVRNGDFRADFVLWSRKIGIS